MISSQSSIKMIYLISVLFGGTFVFFAGELVTPEDDFISPGKIRAHKYLKMTIDFRAEENARLKQEIDRLNSPKRYMNLGKSFP
jgi:hypothetical protein